MIAEWALSSWPHPQPTARRRRSEGRRGFQRSCDGLHNGDTEFAASIFVSITGEKVRRICCRWEGLEGIVGPRESGKAPDSDC